MRTKLHGHHTVPRTHAALQSTHLERVAPLVVDVAAAAALVGVLAAVAAHAVRVRHETAAARAVQRLRGRGAQVSMIGLVLDLIMMRPSDGMTCLRVRRLATADSAGSLTITMRLSLTPIADVLAIDSLNKPND